MELRSAIRKTNESMVGHFAALCLPLISVGLFFRGVDGLAHSIWPSKGVGLVSGLALLGSLPVSLLADTVVAAMYVRWSKFAGASRQSWRTVLRYPGLGATVAHLTGVMLFWLLVATLSGLVVVAAVTGLAAGFEHKQIAPGPHSHSATFLPVVWVVYAFVVARYSFVLPITALRESGSEVGWKDAVVRAKRHLGSLRVITAVEFLGVSYISRFAVLMTGGVGAWHVRPIVCAVADSVVGAVLTTYFVVLKAEMAVQADAEFGG